MENKIIKINKKYSYRNLKNDLEYLKYEYLDNLVIGDIGESILGEKIKFLKIGKGDKKIFINASHHANEWMTSLIIMIFVEKYLNLIKNNQNYKGFNIEELFNKVSFYVVPMVNPDGVDFCVGERKISELEKYKELLDPYVNSLDSWKANIRGVDLNLNYPAGWEQAKINKAKIGVIKPNYRDYVGPNYLSEKETIAMYKFSMIHKFDLSISLHSQGQEIYWNYQNIEVPRAKEIGKKFAKASGYLLTEPVFNSSFAGYKDWFIKEFQKPAYTIEIGKGEEGKSLKLENAIKVYQEVEEIFFIAMEEI
ncbi:MAG: M14 family metallocarboxypeptidase [Clostridia bacterium]